MKHWNHLEYYNFPAAQLYKPTLEPFYMKLGQLAIALLAKFLNM